MQNDSLKIILSDWINANCFVNAWRHRVANTPEEIEKLACKIVENFGASTVFDNYCQGLRVAEILLEIKQSEEIAAEIIKRELDR